MFTSPDSVTLNVLVDGRTVSSLTNVRHATAQKMFAPFVLNWSDLMGNIQGIYQQPTQELALQEMEEVLNDLWSDLEEDGTLQFHGLEIEFWWVNEQK